MIWLQSKDRFNDVAELDETTGAWRVVSRAPGNKRGSLSTDGSYSMLSGVFCALFYSNGEIFVRIGELQVVRLSKDIEITADGPPEKRCLSIMAGGKQLVRHVYSLESQRFEDDTTPFVEDEDFDFGVFLSNIASNPNRQAVVKGEA